MRLSNGRMMCRCILLMVALLAWAGVARAYLVGYPLSLEKLADESDIIFKGTAASTGPVEDEWFKPYPAGYIPYETRFKIVAMIKGDPPGAILRFRHYDAGGPESMMMMYTPQFYRFLKDRTYIVFAKKTADATTCRQLWKSHKGKMDQGMQLCSGDQPITGKTIKEILWNELAAMLKSPDAGDVIYAISQMDQMSGDRDTHGSLQDFDRLTVLASIHGLMASPDAMIAQAAIAVVGSHNPYSADHLAEFWLATIGSAEVPGIGQMNPKMKNPGGELYWQELQAIADGKAPAETRAAAIRALGLVREPALREPLNRWLADTDAKVRAAATVLLADFPGTATNRQLASLAGDPAPLVRLRVAHVIGFSQQTDLAEVLGKLLADQDASVRRAASTSLLSFSPKNAAIASLLQANLKNPEFSPLFLNALAGENPEPHLDALAQVLEKKTDPTNWGGGQIPAFTSWKILFKYLKAQSAEALQSGRLDHYLDALEMVGNYSSSEPRDIYAFYLLNKLPERAKRFREKAKKAVSYDLDYYFKQVDEHPETYR